MMYGIYMYGFLLEKFETPEEGYEAGLYGYEETGIFHEARIVHPVARTINE